VVFLAIVVPLTGCGIYTLDPKGKSAIKTVSIEPFDNQTPEFGLADEVTEAVIDAFIADGNLKVVGNDAADAILVGSLTGYRRVVNQFDENDQVQSYKVQMDFTISLMNPRDQSEIWKEAMPQEGIYDAASETEDEGKRRAAERLVEAILTKTTKSW
jgi:hypothetical protein